MTIHSVKPDNFKAILAINAAGQPGVYPLTPSEMSWALERAAYFGVAEIRGKVVGYIITYTDQAAYSGDEFHWFKQYFAGFLYIDQIAIAPAARRSGAGTRLYHEMEQFARQHGLTSLVCEVNLDPPNPASLRFHAKNGFVEVGTMTTADGRRVSLQRKEL